LSAQGVAVEHLHVPGQIHGFMRFRKALTDTQWGPDAVCGRIGEFLNESI
jgi:acetyl esterase